ncbi:MAG: UDP-N-acetylglucosamine 2-epimerase (non-hydrolyzing) [Pyrinomonadaceae bacterium]|nr:UDP-N-acetylglucosamine 2-epimerase (non-hydrolyzing) [Pyrinomonadaceae bacterium]
MRSIKPKVLIIIGSRPEAIKMAPLVLAMRNDPQAFEVILSATGQQLQMIPQALAEFRLEADLDLEVMQPDQTLAELTSRLMVKLDEIIVGLGPDWVLVQGDTTSAMVGALAGFYRRVAVAHVEAGMRTGNQFSPFPEEINRRIISQCAALHFAPTVGCQNNLLREGVPASRIFVTGNTVIDALLWTRDQVRQQPSALPPNLEGRLHNRRLVLVTSHRRENFGTRLESICLALKELCGKFEDIVVVYPVHPNPNVERTVRRMLGGEPRIELIDPQPYRSFVELIDRAFIILTDSGGLQEEAPSFGKPVLVLRDTTERPEGIEAGTAKLVGTDQQDIVSAAVDLLCDSEQYERMSEAKNPYGDGTAASRIVAVLRDAEVALPRNGLGINEKSVNPLPISIYEVGETELPR